MFHQQGHVATITNSGPLLACCFHFHFLPGVDAAVSSAGQYDQFTAVSSVGAEGQIDCSFVLFVFNSILAEGSVGHMPATHSMGIENCILQNVWLLVVISFAANCSNQFRCICVGLILQ